MQKRDRKKEIEKRGLVILPSFEVHKSVGRKIKTSARKNGTSVRRHVAGIVTEHYADKEAK